MFTKIVLVQFIQDRVVVWCHMLTLFGSTVLLVFLLILLMIFAVSWLRTVNFLGVLYCFSMNLFVSYRCGLSIALSWMAD